MPTVSESQQDYQSINIEVDALYAVASLTFSIDVPIQITWPLKGAGTIEGGTIISTPLPIPVLSGISKLEGEVYDQHIGSSLVAWSDIGNLDFRITRENLAGTTYMRWLGKVYQCMKLGNAEIIYGDGGITAMIPNGRYYETKEIMTPGIAGKLAVSGDEHGHFFISQRGELWGFGENLQLTNHGYKRWFKSLSDLVVLSYIPSLERLYIADGTLGYIWTKHGLSQGWSQLTGIVLKQAYLYGTFCSDPSFEDQLICTDIIDCEIPGLKTISSVRVDGVFGVEPLVALDYRYANSTNWQRSSFKQTCHGVAYPNITAQEFRIVIKIPPLIVGGQSYALQAQLIDLTFTYKKVDRRYAIAHHPNPREGQL